MRRPFSLHDFPSVEGTIACRWAPVLLSPILDSPEKLVIGVVAANGGGFHIERANALNRLQCLFGKAAETAIFAAEVAFEELAENLSESGHEALRERALVFTGVTLGEVRGGEGNSLRDVARTWMSALSSLYEYRADTAVEVVAMQEAAEELGARGGDRLPIMVLEDVVARNPAYGHFFSEEIRMKRQRRSKVADIGIDFSSPDLVANFATLGPSAQAKSVDRIKRKLFDLIVRRDAEQTTFLPRAHEMIVYSPGIIDPLISEKQRDQLDEVHDELGEQSKREEIGFLPVTGVSDITQRILQTAAGHA
ncbi:hypothetical protein HNP32_002351 [Brevundimonas bullata]|uniref:Uncharacterized protein n=1 Tax=Brevundimonas bullata TaxID=13160 RepID=A0A7W7IQG7_9CAUL|nr:hypothetical protein [Brevundimonas bullata]MBB4798607.1 hypothetical protein [Brevundimonas bullata]MBB6383078.1 hypothetical protein [Brevundimonas bullata]